MRSRLTAAAVAGTLIVALAGCTGANPRPSPSPTPPFASADAAYRAAEATYRAYVDALNQVDLKKPQTFEVAYSWLLVDALDHQRKEFTGMASRDLTLSGDSRVTLVQPREGGDPRWGDVRMAVCLDVSKVDVRDAGGTSLVRDTRPDVQPLTVELVRDAGTRTGMKIISITARDGSPECES